MDPGNLNYFEALASQTRLEILQILAKGDRNIKELAEALNISSSIMTKHIRKLESARLITTKNASKGGNRQKVCTLLNLVTEIHPPPGGDVDQRRRYYESELPVGLFSALQADPPCGMAAENRVLGGLDRPAYLYSPKRVQAEMLWLGKGYVEYTLPNYLQKDQLLTGIELTGEFGSGTGEPVSVEVWINGETICAFSTVGGEGPGHWPFSRYGILTTVRMGENGVFLNGEKKTEYPLSQLPAGGASWTVRFAVAGGQAEDASLVLFGEALGDNRQPITMRVYYV